MAEDDRAGPGVEARQERHDALRRQRLGQAREADDVGEEHRHVAGRRRAEAMAGRRHHGVGDVGRDVAGEVGPGDLGAALPAQGPARPPDGGGEEAGDDRGEHDLVEQLAEADEGRVEDDAERRPGRYRVEAGGRLGEAQGVGPEIDQEEADRPDDDDAEPRPEHVQGRVGEGGAGEQEQEVEEVLEAQAHLDRPADPRFPGGGTMMTATISATSRTVKTSLIGTARRCRRSR